MKNLPRCTQTTEMKTALPCPAASGWPSRPPASPRGRKGRPRSGRACTARWMTFCLWDGATSVEEQPG